MKKRNHAIEKIFTIFTIALMLSLTVASAESMAPKEIKEQKSENAVSVPKSDSNFPMPFSELFNLDILPGVKAASGCCEINTAATQFCSNSILENQCKPGYFHTGASCSQISECNAGVCVPRSNGPCLEGKYKAECRFATDDGKIINGDWFNVVSKSEVADCQEACCNVADRECNIKEKKMCEVDSKGIWDGTVTDIGVCNNRCFSEAYGCCHRGTGNWLNTVQKSCGSAGDEFYGNGVYCSSIFESHIAAHAKVKADDRGTPPLTNDCYYYDSSGVREGVAKDCTADEYCNNLPASEGGIDVTAECKSTKCVETNEFTTPSDFKNGESLCLNIAPGHYNPGMRSSYLQDYILRCQNGVITPDTDFDKNLKHDSVCVEGAGTDNLWHAKGMTNKWAECGKCGEGGTLPFADVLGYVPLIGTTIASFLGKTCGGGWQSGFMGEECSSRGRIGSVDAKVTGIADYQLADTGAFIFCGHHINPEKGKYEENVYSYDFDLWTPIGSCNPIFPPGRGSDDSQKDTCGSCGKGGDEITNPCTQEECEHQGDCQFKPAAIDIKSLVAAGVMSFGACQLALLIDGATPLIKTPGVISSTLCYGLYGAAPAGAWYVTILTVAGISLAKSTLLGSIGAANANPDLTSQQWTKVGDKVQLKDAIVIAKDLNTKYGIFEVAGRSLAFAASNIPSSLIYSTAMYLSVGGVGKVAANIGREIIYQEAYKAFIKEALGPAGIVIGTGADTIKTGAIKAGKDAAAAATTEEALKKGSGVVGILADFAYYAGIVLDLWSLSKSMNPGTCEPESPYTTQEKTDLFGTNSTKICEICGSGEGQWYCLEKRCAMLGSDCVWKKKSEAGKAEDGNCFTTKPTDVSPPVVNSITVTLKNAAKIVIPSTDSNAGVAVSLNGTYDKVKYMDVEVVTGEEAYCKITDTAGKSYTDIGKTFDAPAESGYPTTHNIKDMDITASTSSNLRYTFYIKCEDVSGNRNSNDDYSITFVVNPPAEYVKPEIQYVDPSIVISHDTNIINLSILAYDYNNVSTCKYSFNSTDWSNMTTVGTRNAAGWHAADCYSGRSDAGACDFFNKNNVNLENEQDLTVSTELAEKFGMTPEQYLRNAGDLRGSKLYFLYIGCEDNSPQHNKMIANFTLMKTSLFNMSVNSPKGSIYEKTPTIELNTTRQTICTYKINLKEYNFTNDIAAFNNLHSIKHPTALEAGTYTLNVICKDMAGTKVSQTSSFQISTDTIAPKMIRVYNKNGLLHIATDKPSTCSYDIKNCNFDINAGTNLPFDMTLEHETLWRSDATFYIKCKNEWGIESCVTIKPINLGVTA